MEKLHPFKGTVESFFDTLNDQLIASLPGRTFRSWERRADYNADDGPLIPYDALVEVVHLHLIDVYSASKHPTASTTRLEVWQEGAAEYPPCLPASPDELIVLLAKRVERTLSPRGLEVNGMFYNSDELMALRAELAANNARVEKFQIRYNPWDLGHAWVLNPLDKRYLQVTAADAAMFGITEYQWKVLRRAVRDKFDQPEHLMGLAASRNVIREVVEAATQTPSRRRRTRATRFLGTQQVSPNAISPPSDATSSEGDEYPLVTTDAPSVDECDDRHMPNAEESKGESTSEAFSLDDLDVDDWDVASD